MLPKIYARPFINNLREIPEKAVLITFGNYLIILRDMLVGRVSDHEKIGIRTESRQKSEKIR